MIERAPAVVTPSDLLVAPHFDFWLATVGAGHVIRVKRGWRRRGRAQPRLLCPTTEPETDALSP